MSALPRNQAIDQLIYQQQHKRDYIVSAVICIAAGCALIGLMIAVVMEKLI